MGLSVTSIISRVLFILFAIVVLVLSVLFMRDPAEALKPAVTRYSVFAGGFSVLAGLLGLIALWLEKIPPIVPIILDAIAAILFLVGGVLWALWMSKQHICVRSHEGDGKPPGHDLFSLNSTRDPLSHHCSRTIVQVQTVAVTQIKNVCQTALANVLYHFLAFVTAVTLLLLGLLAMKRMASLLGRSPAY